MKYWVGVTNNKWFRFLTDICPDEVNFWRPLSTRNFEAIETNALFLFKLHAPINAIAGGGFFVRHTILPLSLAWDAFGEKNGASDLATFSSLISSIRRDRVANPNIGCTIITQPFFWPEERWIAVPDDWSPNLVQGRTYDQTTAVGSRLWNAVMERLQSQAGISRKDLNQSVHEPSERYGSEVLVTPRLGQGAFRVLVTDAYSRRCAMTGERTLPVLEASHIKPYAESGPHSIDNGLLLRSDLHTLFDRGYVTIASDYRINISRRIKAEFENGREYYALHGRPLAALPKDSRDRPGQEFIEWHNKNVFAE